MSEQLRGVVQRILKTEGYGFIREEATGEDYFFHRGAVERTAAKSFEQLEKDDHVRFTPIAGRQGRPRAIEVAVL